MYSLESLDLKHIKVVSVRKSVQSEFKSEKKKKRFAKDLVLSKVEVSLNKKRS